MAGRYEWVRCMCGPGLARRRKTLVMKTKFRGGWKLACVLVALPLVAASLQNPQDSAAGDTPGDTNAAAPLNPPPPAGDFSAPETPGTIETNQPTPNVKLSTGAAEVVRLAQSGVGEDVMVAYI